MRRVVLPLVIALAVPAQQALAVVVLENHNVHVEVGDFGDSDCLKIRADNSIDWSNDWLQRFMSFVSINEGWVQPVDEAHFFVDAPVHHIDPVWPYTVPYRTASVVSNSTIKIVYSTAVRPMTDPGIGKGFARWDVYADIYNLTDEPVSLKYYWYLNLDYGGFSAFDSARMEAVEGGLQMHQAKGLLDISPAYFIDTMSPSRWEIDDYPHLYDKLWWATGPVDLLYGRDEGLGQVFGPYDVTAAYQHDFTLEPKGCHMLYLSPESDSPVPEPSGLVVWGLGIGLAAAAGWLGGRRRNRSSRARREACSDFLPP